MWCVQWNFTTIKWWERTSINVDCKKRPSKNSNIFIFAFCLFQMIVKLFRCDGTNETKRTWHTWKCIFYCCCRHAKWLCDFLFNLVFFFGWVRRRCTIKLNIYIINMTAMWMRCHTMQPQFQQMCLSVFMCEWLCTLCKRSWFEIHFHTWPIKM